MKRLRRPRLWWDGREMPGGRVPWEGALRLGDGVFETLRTWNGAPFLWRAHLDRMRKGARALHLQGLPSRLALERALLRALPPAPEGVPPSETTVRIALVQATPRAALLLQAEPMAPPATARRRHEQGLDVGTSSYLHPGLGQVPPGATAPVKWLGRGWLAHALREARARGWAEALLPDPRGRLVEGTRSNLLVVSGRRLLAPGPASGALAGVTRALALRVARRGHWTEEDRAVAPDELRRASEVLLTSSLLGVAPVRSFDRRRLRGEGALGPFGEAVRRALNEAIVREGIAWARRFPPGRGGRSSRRGSVGDPRPSGPARVPARLGRRVHRSVPRRT